MRTRRRFGVAILLGLTASASLGEVQNLGSWQPQIDTPFRAVHSILLRTGIVLCIDDRPEPGAASQAFLFNPATDATTTAFGQPTENLFCSGHAQLPDGRVFFVSGGSDLPGGSWTRVFDPGNLASPWSDPGDLPGGQRRWYPTCTALGDGSILITGGREYCEVNLPANRPVMFEMKPTGG